MIAARLKRNLTLGVAFAAALASGWAATSALSWLGDRDKTSTVAPAGTAETHGGEPARRDTNSPWGADYFPNVPVTSHDGRVFNFYDDLIKDKIVVVNFIYTSCSNICPLVTARLSQVKDVLGDRVGRDIFFYSITIDPVVDGPEVLKKYAQTYRAGPGWMFLTGEPEHIDLIRKKLGERSRSKAEHRNDVMIGNDTLGNWGRDSAFSDIKVIAESIRRMDPKHREMRRNPGSLSMANTSYTLHDKPGMGLFAKACSGCHTIGYGDLVGPDLAGVIERRDPEWLRRFMREPDALRQEKDELATSLDARYPGAKMPNLGLSKQDVDDLLVYLEAAHAQNGGKSALAAPKIIVAPEIEAATP